MVISGSAGAGKAELVKEYIRNARESDTYRGIFWIDATTDESTRHGIDSIVEKMKVPGPSFPNQSAWHRILVDVHRYPVAPFLFVFDNANDASVIKKCLDLPIVPPILQQAPRHFIVTTLQRDFISLFPFPVSSVHLERLDAIESKTLFSSAYGEKMDLTAESRNDLLDKLGCSPASFTSLFELVGASPLYIKMAAAYMRETCQHIPTYLNL